MGRRTVVGGVALVATLAAAAPAAGQTAPCPGKALKGAECGTVTVPLDHSHQVAGEIPIAFARFRATRASRGTIVFLAGGPGEAAIRGARALMRGPLAGVRRRFDVVLLDQRGTGRSAPLTCSAAPRGRLRLPADAGATEVAQAVSACATELGERRRFFSTYETVLDIEDVRRGLGIERIIPLGVSYGGQVAGAYARRFPERVQALVLDSTSPIEGLDLLGRLPHLALPRVLRELCFPPGCAKLLGNPSALLEAAVARARDGALSGSVVRPSGRKR